MPFVEAEVRPFETVMSGPVAGAVGSAELARQLGIALAVTADVGGTTFDTCLILDGQPQLKFEGNVAGMPLQTTWVDVRSIGAGGGSIAYIESGLLHVGPRSAGADPGPVCYGRGGTEPTVTDAAASLGMLAFGELAGDVRLDIPAANGAIAGLAAELALDPDRAAQGVMAITAASMANAIRAILEEVGEDPRDAALLAFGGAGPLFGTLLAHELDISTIVIPNYAGNFSAWGLLLQDLARAAARTVIAPLSNEGLAQAAAVAAELAGEMHERVEESPVTFSEQPQTTVSLDLRYQGQEYFLTVETPFRDGAFEHAPDEIRASFERDYVKRYGHALASAIEIVAVRVMSVTPLPKTTLLETPPTTATDQASRQVEAFSFSRSERVEFTVVDRSSLGPGNSVDGPAILLEETATTYVDDGFRASVHKSGALFLTQIDEDRDGGIS
jgi:N-methylhydantoinase A